MAQLPNRPGWQQHPEAQLPRDPRDTSTKVSFQPQQFRDLINNQGVRINLYRTLLCPRVRSIDGREHDINCPLCRGAQFIDRYPIQSKAVIYNQSASKEAEGPAREGFIDGNTALATFDLGLDLQYFSLIELCDFYEGYQQRILKQEGDLDVLKYHAKQVNLLVDYDGVEYSEGADFKISLDGNLQWCIGEKSRRPRRGTVYAVHYDTLIKFRATRAMHVNRFANVRENNVDRMVRMPVQWEITKDYLVVRKDLQGVEREENKIRESRESDEGYQKL